jgi:hypothetical protein
MSAAITCCSCNRPLKVPESVLGHTVQCPLCLDEFIARADPAAEAAARAAEPPPRRTSKPQTVVAAVRTELAPEQAPLAQIVEEEPAAPAVLEALPVAPSAPKSGPKRAFVFPVMVTRDPDRVLRGLMDGELTAEGLYLRKLRQPPAFAARGARARYLGANRLTVTVEGREIEMTVNKKGSSNYHLAQDTAAFLSGKGEYPKARSYHLPWYLFAFPWLFLALPFAASPFGLLTDGCLGAFLWTVVALVLAGATLVIVAQARLRPRARLNAGVVLLGVGVMLPLLAIPLTPSYTVDPALWTMYTPPDKEFTVLLPDVARIGRGTPGEDPAAKEYFVDVQQPEIHFRVYVSLEPKTNNFANLRSAENEQAVNAAKTLLMQEYNLNDYEWNIDQMGNQRGAPYRELFCQIPRYGGLYAGQSLAARVYVVNGKVFTLTAIGPRVRLDGADVVKFFDSANFPPTLTKPGAPPRGPAAPHPVSPTTIDGLLAYWSFNLDQMPFNQAIPDETLNNPDGVAHNATLVPDGVNGGAIHINGRGSYFDFNDAANLNFGDHDDFTFCGWLRTRAVQGTVLSNRNEADAGACIDVTLDGGKLSAQVREDGAPDSHAPLNLVSAKPVNDGVWRHFALTRRGGGVGLYIDGVLQGERNGPEASGSITTNLRALGAELYWFKTGFGQVNASFGGDLDEFCVFSRALTADEIRKLAGR